MLIPITFNASSSGNPKLPPALARISHDEVVLIELQGALQVECNHPSERDGQLVGKLTMNESTSKPTLVIGHHLLEGKIVNLPKALAVLQRTESPICPVSSQDGCDGDGDMMDCDSDDAPQGGSQRKTAENRAVEWNAIAIVKRKILFSKRPMPIVGKK